MLSEVQIVKRDHNGNQKIKYSAIVLEQTDHWVCVEAYFQLDAVDIGLIVFCKGDRMVEWFYKDRCFNIFQVEDGDTRQIKGWYCNITRPPEFTPESIAADDLALDVFVSPSGEVTVLDEDEFAALDLTEDEQQQAHEAILTLKEMVKKRDGAFSALDS